MKKARVLYADPPWPEPSSFIPDKKKKNSGQAVDHYALMTIEEIHDFALPPLHDDCFLFLWCPHRKFEQAIDTMEAWGFEYCKTGIVWVKMTKDGERVRTGMGIRIRMCHELCLLGRQGRPKQENKNTKSVILAPWRKHSQKPEEMYELIEAYSKGPYTELFARQTRQKWQSLGNELQERKQDAC